MEKIITENFIKATIITKFNQQVVRSDNLAKVFGKLHKNILKNIRQQIEFIASEKLSLGEYFIEESITTTKGKNYTRYYQKLKQMQIRS